MNITDKWLYIEDVVCLAWMTNAPPQVQIYKFFFFKSKNNNIASIVNICWHHMTMKLSAYSQFSLHGFTYHDWNSHHTINKIKKIDTSIWLGNWVNCPFSFSVVQSIFTRSISLIRESCTLLLLQWQFLPIMV